MTPALEQAWIRDEAERLTKIVIKDMERQKWRKIRVAEDEKNLPDYPRPLMSIPRVKKKVSIIKLIKSILP